MFLGPLALFAAVHFHVADLPDTAASESVANEPAANEPAARDDSDGQNTLAAHLQTARLLVQENPERGLPIALALLVQLQEHPRELARNPDLQRARVEALLEVARAELQRGDKSNASIHIDEALWIEPQALTIAQRLGPSLNALTLERKAVRDQASRFTVFVQCSGPCEIYVNEVETANHELKLPLGYFRLTVLDPTGRLPALRKELIGTLGETTMALSFGPTAAPSPSATNNGNAVQDEVPTVVQSPLAAVAPSKRWLPRWASLTGLGVGIGLSALGGVMLGLDGACREAAAGGSWCKRRYQTAGVGWSGVGVGAALSISALIVLVRDEIVVARGNDPTR